MTASGAPRPFQPRPPPANTSSARSKRLVVAIVVAVAYAYLVALAALAIGLRMVGERWWLTAALLYFPRALFAVPLPFTVLALVLARQWVHLPAQLVALWIVLRPLMGFTYTFAPERRSGPVVRVLSYNVDSLVAGADTIAREIDRYSPDVVFLQEIGDGNGLERVLRERYATVRIDNQFAVATRYPIVSQSDPGKLDYEGRRRSARFMQYQMETPVGTIAFYNVHPISPRFGLMALRRGGWRKSLLSGQFPPPGASDTMVYETGLRETQVADFALAASHESLPVVIAGDTNLPDLSRAFGHYLSSYQDAFPSVGRGFGYTFPTRRPWMRIDRILANDALRFVSFRVGDGSASDHLCVVADLQRK